MKNDSLIIIAKKRFYQNSNQSVHFTNIPEIDNFLNNLKDYPHAYVLACLMDRQIKAERAWEIPYRICQNFNAYSIEKLIKIDKQSYIDYFEKYKLHRFNKQMATIFYMAIHKIEKDYRNNAAFIWADRPSSSTVVYRFLEFVGSGIKISTMAANILARQFRIPFSDYYSIDISPDVHIRRVLIRMGYVPMNATNDMIIYKAREINPDFPGIIDFSCWEIGRNWCHPRTPDCLNCIVNNECKKHI